MSLQQLKEIALRGKELYPSRHMRKQWIAKTVLLQESGKHLLINGSFPKRD
jgi:hypothetical protein